jgi:hypothetical protein
MRRPLPCRPEATPAPPPVPGGTRGVHGPVLPRNHPAFLGNPEDSGLHRSQSAIGLPALEPPMRRALGGPLGAVGEIAPAAAGDEDVEQRVDHLTKGGMRHAPPPRRGLWRQKIGQELPLQVA